MSRSIYVDIDDVLSQTIESLIDLLEHLHDRRVDVDEVLHFDLEKSFGLDVGELAHLMDHACRDDRIESMRPTRGSARVLDRWNARGDRVRLVTGRPPSTREASRRWLDQHRIPHASLHHLDKWQRPDWNVEDLPALRFEDIERFRFDFAVEDNLDTAARLIEEFEIPVALMDRPWNRDVAHLRETTLAGLVRCRDWLEIERAFA